MGVIKFEIDIPEFENELNINLTLKKDGKVIETYSPTTPLNKVEVKEIKKEKKTTTTTPKKSSVGGNLMNFDDF